MYIYDWFFMVYIFVVGLIFGSFFNVVILRPFSNESIVMPPSKCPKCNHKLAWYDNIPVLSYIMLGAKCRYCKEPIHWQYPLVELTTAVLFLCAYLKFDLTWQFLFMAIALSFFVIMSGTDFKEQVVFDIHFILFIIAGVIYGLFVQNNIIEVSNMFMDFLASVWNFLIQDSGPGVFIGGMLFGYLIMEILRGLGYLIAKKSSFGEGDTYIAIGIGAFLGAKGVILTIILAALLQSIWGIPMLIHKYIYNKKYSELMTMGVLVIIIACYCWLNYYGAFESMPLLLFFVVLMLVYALKVCKELVDSVHLEGAGIYLPFGPALFIGAAIIIFFGDKIYTLLRHIDWLANIV